ncbi:recombinase family protein [Chamaesiphon minutus]|uniref:Site-specific recombinase, DNA invertase Pin n=1 Tax=Chamaesiphon minutus (strain ATCC 27169 / PCC 6605) TaxID=1173020 RepID=K9UKA4_CHAP6|nr:recombinase family protein [Chamaesiphon minutus]AFY94634.1 site-specific recombinase, DNA invertase Pin [Chamaesiphon minutus PCC 6605]
MMPDDYRMGIIAIRPFKQMVEWTLKITPHRAAYRVQILEGKNGQLRAAIYTRVSTADQDCDRQYSELVSYAARCNYAVVGNYSESASGARLDRVERRKILQLARERSIDIILVSELTRWGRSTIDLIDTLHQLQSWGVSLIAQNGFQFDLSTPHGKMIASIMATLAEFERDLLKERVKSGIAQARAKGKIFGRAKVDTSSRCKKVNELRCQKLSERAIAKKMNLSKSTVNNCARCECLPEGMDW